MRLPWPPSVPTWMDCRWPLNWPPLASSISHRTRYSPAWSKVSLCSQVALAIYLPGSRRSVGRLPGAMTCSHPRNKSSSATSLSWWMARLEQEHENLRASLFWLLAQVRVGREQSKQQAEQALRLCTALSWFWSIRGYSREGQTFLEQALALRESVSASVKAKAFYT